MNRDRNLLFGVFAVQLKKITPSQLVDAAGAWAMDPGRELSLRLVEAGALKEADRALLDGLVDQAVAAHGGDIAATLQSFGGERQIQQTFCGSIVLEQHGGVSLASAATKPMATVEENDGLLIQETPRRYTREREHGRGGMGRVLVAHDALIGRDIALKELHPELYAAVAGKQGGASPTVPVVARFMQEARVTGQLEHPSIVPVYEVGTRLDGAIYYTMKLVRGRSLSKAISEAGTLDGRLKLLPHFLSLCQAISFAHSKGVIHRDIKPSNVIMGDFGETAVIDWGLAKIRGKEDIHERDLVETLHAIHAGKSDSARTAYGEAIGTPAYMPAEQAAGALEQIDERSDVYSLGAVLYEILTGVVPFSGLGTRDVIRLVQESKPAPIRTLVREAPVELVAIAEKAMQREKAARYGSATELAADVGKFLNGAIVSAYHYTTPQRIGRFYRQNRGAVWASALGAAALIIATSLYIAIITNANRAIQLSNEELKLAHSVERNLREEAQSATRLAEAEKATSEQFSTMLFELFEAANEYERETPDLLPQDLLTTRAIELNTHLAEQPLIRARLMESVGKIYGFFGHNANALPLIEAALQIRRQEQGAQSLDVAKNLTMLGYSYNWQRRYAHASTVLEDALKIQRAAADGEAEALADTLMAYAHTMLDTEQFAKAEAFLVEALELVDKPNRQAEVLHSLGHAHEAQGNFDASKDAYQRSYDLTRSIFGEEDHILKARRACLVRVMNRKGDRGEAVALLQPPARSVQPDAESVAPAADPEVSLASMEDWPLAQQAAAYYFAGDYARAKPYFEEKLRRFASSPEPDALLIAKTSGELAQILLELGQPGPAKELLQRAWQIAVDELGEGHATAVQYKENLDRLPAQP